MDPRVVVLRLGHRPARDRRVTTHVCLTARALGADRVIVSTKDSSVERSVRDVVARFGGDFEVETGVPWRRVLSSWRGTVVHLTMYGEPIDDVLPRVPQADVLVVVGAEKVPGEVFGRADFNV
ncbi:MAG: tRNA (cytidine(56)-2'-O)-methyltransferase, partial [Candidatus Thermoplasmatota archaeon]